MRLSLTLGLVAALVLPAAAADDFVVAGELVKTLLPFDGIPAIDEPELVTAKEADGFMAKDETVIGLVGPDGQARAYSALLLDRLRQG